MANCPKSYSKAFLVENSISVPNIYSYIRLSFVFDKSVAFFVLQFYFSLKSGGS